MLKDLCGQSMLVGKNLFDCQVDSFGSALVMVLHFFIGNRVLLGANIAANKDRFRNRTERV